MVDIETTGTKSYDHNAIIQIAAVKFNYDTEMVSDNIFNMCLAIPAKRYWEEGTREWWNKHRPHILQDIRARAMPADQVMRAYHKWLLEDYPMNDEGLRFWGKPTHFDFSFIASYLDDYGLLNPCHYRFARDQNSFMAGLSGSPNHISLEDEIEFKGDAHNAIYDTFHQIKVLFAAKNKYLSLEVLNVDS